jgi:hypothetical protein
MRRSNLDRALDVTLIVVLAIAAICIGWLAVLMTFFPSVH